MTKAKLPISLDGSSDIPPINEEIDNTGGFEIVDESDFFVLKKNENVLFRIQNPNKTYSDDSIISAGLAVYAGLYQILNEIKSFRQEK